MPVMERVVRSHQNRISLDIPREFADYTFRVVLIPIPRESNPKYDFSDIAGKLNWQGDAVEEQRRLRDEW